MDNYVIMGETDEEPLNPFPAPFNSVDAKVMLISKSSKFSKINGHVMEYFKENSESNRFVVFKSVNEATEKVISCVEVFKQQFEEPLYQWTRVSLQKRVVLWKCQQEGPRDIRVTVEIPVIFIVVSRDSFPGIYSCMSMQCSSDRDIAFMPSIRSSKTSSGKSNQKQERKGNRKMNEGNKWTKPTAEQRKKEHKERDLLLREIEATSLL